ncbi:MAG: hypothetical protein HS111_12385 [Kofleriaceae bacterium]|nr:hypothetical protein [Kofleriaceae bacterium]
MISASSILDLARGVRRSPTSWVTRSKLDFEYASSAGPSAAAPASASPRARAALDVVRHRTGSLGQPASRRRRAARRLAGSTTLRAYRSPSRQ